MVSVREYQPEDQAIMEGFLTEFQEYERQMESDHRPGSEIAAPYLQYLIAQSRDASGRLLVAEGDGGSSGYIAFWPEVDDTQFCYTHSSEVRICDLYVSPLSRGQGVGRLLVEQAEELARQKHVPRVMLDVLSSNTNARKMYEKLGFRDYEVKMVKDL